MTIIDSNRQSDCKVEKHWYGNIVTILGQESIR